MAWTPQPDDDEKDSGPQLTDAQWKALGEDPNPPSFKQPLYDPAANASHPAIVRAGNITSDAAPDVNASAAPGLPTVGGGIPTLAKPTTAESHAAGKAEFEAGQPVVSAQPFTPEWARQREEQLEYKKAHPLGSDVSAMPGVGGKILHGFGRAANIAGDILAPGITAGIPGSDLNNRIQEGRFQKEFTGALGNEKTAADTNLAGAEAWKDLNPVTVGKTPDEQAFANLLTQTNPDTNRPYSPLEAFTKLKQAAQDVKPEDPQKQPVGEAGAKQSAAQLATLTQGMDPAGKAAFMSAYAIQPTDTVAQATKKVEDAKASAQMSGAERDRKIARDAVSAQREATNADRVSKEGLETVQYKDKDGNLVSGSLADAKAAGGSGIRKVAPGDEQKARTAYTQYGRWIDNAQNASDTMAAWDNPKDKNLAIRLQHNFFEHAIIPGVGIDPDYVNTFLNSDDYKALSPLGQAHMQNMTQVWSDAINLMKQETGGVPRGEHFLKLESAILPQPDKTQAMNRQSLKQFEQRIKTDATEFARPNDMHSLGGVIPEDAQSKIMLQGHAIGYVDHQGKQVLF